MAVRRPARALIPSLQQCPACDGGLAPAETCRNGRNCHAATSDTPANCVCKTHCVTCDGLSTFYALTLADIPDGMERLEVLVDSLGEYEWCPATISWHSGAQVFVRIDGGEPMALPSDTITRLAKETAR